MSPKELLYIEDTLGHEKQLKTICCEFANQIQDMQLKTFISQMSAKHEELYNKFFSLLNC